VNSPPLDKVWKKVLQLSLDDQNALRRLLAQEANRRISETVLSERTRYIEAERWCPRCGGEDVVRHGRDARGAMRWRCRDPICGRTFGPRTGTHIARLRHPEKWARFVDLMTRLAPQLLTDGMMKGRGEDDVAETVQLLASKDRFFSHGSVIDHLEAEQLGLSVHYLPESSKLLRRIWLLYCMYAYDVQRSGAIKVFEGRSRSISIMPPPVA
jgi:transposase-like protein